MTTHKTIGVIISGKVQGVFYRATAKKKAEGLGLTGWVKNTSEGNVEMLLCGYEPALNEMISWCHSGPPSARVVDVTTTDLPYQPYKSFVILR